ncbi:MAG: PqiC family protein [Candidatus Syntrophosphaera sp.]|nr:PqiC family protein [Candidatus Syntrophosphaera sp.]
MRLNRLVSGSLALLSLLLLGGCFGKVTRMPTNYYVLDYQRGTENPSLRQSEPFPKTLEVLDAVVNRTYARNQIVVKDNFTRVRYLPNDLWANRLSDSVPNLLVRRFQAYNIFHQVDRSTGDFKPDYYLETNIQNLERVESGKPRAYLRADFYLRDPNQNILMTYKAERYADLPDDSTVFLVQTYNTMLMQEADILAGRISLFLAGKEFSAVTPDSELRPLEAFLYTEASESAQMTADGELLLLLTSPQVTEILYSIEGTGQNDRQIYRNNLEFNEIVTLNPGKYRVTIGDNQEIQIDTEIRSKMRTVIRGEWSELAVKIIDQNQNRVRLSYDIWYKNPNEYDYTHYGSDISVGDDDLGQPDKLWILRPGTYMIKLRGGSWNDLRDFTTVNVNKGDSDILTVVVDPSGEGNFLVGAGILGEDPILPGRAIVHRGAVHGYLNLSSNNNVDMHEPTYGLSITGQLDNKVDANFPNLHYTGRSYYDLGMNRFTNSDLRISTDSYSLKNVQLFTPWENSNTLRNFSFYGRGDIYSHFFDENLYFSADKNLILISSAGDTLDVRTGQDRLKTKIAGYPLRLKEGTGLTYRWAINPKVTLSLRGGYGWQQVYNKSSFVFTKSGASLSEPDGLAYDVYRESKDQSNHGLESTLVLTAINLLNFLTVNSSFDVLFPLNKAGGDPSFDSENRVNFRIYRNVSLDMKLNFHYDTSKNDWVVYDFGSYLRLSLYY